MYNVVGILCIRAQSDKVDLIPDQILRRPYNDDPPVHDAFPCIEVIASELEGDKFCISPKKVLIRDLFYVN